MTTTTNTADDGQRSRRIRIHYRDREGNEIRAQKWVHEKRLHVEIRSGGSAGRFLRWNSKGFVGDAAAANWGDNSRMALGDAAGNALHIFEERDKKVVRYTASLEG